MTRPHHAEAHRGERPGTPDALPKSEDDSAPDGDAERTGRRRAGQLLRCGWCNGEIRLRRTGRTPKWCSATCRHRAWEHARAAAKGAVRVVEVVDRLVEVEVEVRVPHVEQVEVLPRGGPGWLPALGELARQLETDRIYDRDLPALGEALQQVIGALRRRSDSQARFRSRR